MNEKKKGFNLFPEYVWMIFVGMLLAILILTNVIPGHADEVSPTPTVTPVPTSALDPTDACLPIYIMGQTYMLFVEDSSTVLSYFQQYDNDLITRDELLELAYFSRVYQLDNDNSAFFRDVKIALTQLRSQFKGFFVDLIDVGAAKGAYESLYSSVSEVGVPIAQSYGDYSTNRVLYMANGVFIDVPIWVWNTAIPTPTPSPIPPEPEILSFVFSAGGSYYLVDTFASLSFGNELSGTYDPFVYVRNKYSYYGDLPLLRPSLVYCSSSASNVSLYFPGNSVSEVRIYNTGSSLVPDFDYVRDNFSYTSMSSSGSYGDFEFYLQSSNQGSFTLFSVAIRKGNWSQNPSLASAPGIAQYSYSSSPYNAFEALDFNPSYSDYCPVVYGIELMVDLRSDPNLPEPTPTNAPTATPAPLPTSGESIHVILPTGTPSPTPPFTVPGGSDGTSGFDSPGSIGSGLSSGQTSGVLQAWNMYVSDNPAMLFLTSTFQALPPELLYPLYILLFILLLLAVIRLFVHFSGG